MLTLTPDERALLTAVIAEPSCDVVRGAFADMLQGNAEQVTCGTCGGDGYGNMAKTAAARGSPHNPDYWSKCSTCSGSCVVSDGREEYAEFIRVQIEIAIQRDAKRRPAASEANDRLQDDLSRRERELFDSHRAEWFPYAEVITFLTGSPTLQAIQPTGHPFAIVRRGFVAEVRGTLESLRGTACGACGGSGERTRINLRGLTLNRELCEQCHGIGRVGGVLRELAGSQPVERVEVTDVIREWGPAVGGHQIRRNEIGEEIWGRMHPRPEWSNGAHREGTRAELSDALSRVMLAEARDDEAKLASVLT